MVKTLLPAMAFMAFATYASGALTVDELSALKRKLADSDPAIRRAALVEIEKKQPATIGNEILPLLPALLADQDAGIRAETAGVLAAISLSTAPKFRQLNGQVTDIRSCAAIEPALLRAFDDPDEETRKNALAAYVFAFEVSPAVQDRLASRYDSERSFSIFRTAILEALTIDGAPTGAAMALLLRVANDPAEAGELAQVLTDSKQAPVELLPAMISQFSSAKDAPRKAAFVRAIRKFGAAAKPYLVTLEQAADSESDKTAKRNMVDAIAAIKAAQ